MRKLTLALLIFSLLLVGCGGSGGTTVEEDLTPCQTVFKEAAEKSDLEDSVDDLNLAFVECETEEEWIAASEKYPAALDGADPITFINNRCEFGPFNKQNSLCANR